MSSQRYDDDGIRAVDENGDTVLSLGGDGTNYYRGFTPVRAADFGTLSFHQPVAPLVNVNSSDPITVTSEDGRVLLRIKRDGTVDGSIEDASEAARIFVAEVRKLVQYYGDAA